MNDYDYLIVGAGLFGAVFAYEATKAGKKCLVLDKRNHAGGNVYCENNEGINVHKYGAHIFHTNDKGLWDYVNQFVEFNHYVNSPLAHSKGKLFNLPFNMNTFYQLWGTKTPEEAKNKINEQIALYGVEKPKNLEEQALSLVGKDIYEQFIKEYTEKAKDKEYIKERIAEMNRRNGDGVFESKPGKFFIKEFPSGTATLTDIKKYLKQVKVGESPVFKSRG